MILEIPRVSISQGLLCWTIKKKDQLNIINIQEYGMGIFGKKIRELKG
jgi:hypothetical protein